MADQTPHTLIIGDEIGGQLYDAFQQIPGTGAIWKDTLSPSSIGFWASGSELDQAWDKIAAGSDEAHVPDSMPDGALVSLGRWEILNEPDNLDPDDLKTLEGDVGRVIDRLKDLGISKIAWVLPPAITNEGKVRVDLEKMLAKKGVRVFHANNKWSDRSSRGAEPKRLSNDTIQEMAKVIATWMPLGSPAAHGVTIGPRHPEGQHTPTAFPATKSFVGRLSTPAKVGLVAALGLAIGGGAYAAGRKYRG